MVVSTDVLNFFDIFNIIKKLLFFAISCNDIFTKKGTLSNLKLSAVEHCILDDIKIVIMN
ncbi:hypothetical protein [Borreliella lanei]|uniref:Uncharacterized protein n=1 Tax=Borreliella lanei TaxID=373540 RepID=A0A7W9ZBQ8_9SPIR|nr:hypothetical protein [Borreliella lanei]MBB6208506.1 hypothetical protein [Borreliella lanei]